MSGKRRRRRGVFNCRPPQSPPTPPDDLTIRTSNIMRRPWNFVAAIGLAACGVAGIGVWRYVSFAAAADAAPKATVAPAIPATIGTAERKNVPVYINGLGTVQAYETVTVNTRVDGTLDKVSFAEGQDVNAGDVLAQIDPRPFKASLDLAVATRAKDQAQLENARLDFKRFQDSGTLATTQQQIDTQAALVRQLVATVQADDANVEAARVQLDYTTIRAPVSGRAGIRLVDEGNIVHAASTTGLVVITQLKPISVVFTLPQDQLQSVIHEMTTSKAPLVAVAQGRDDRRTLDTGTLTLVDNQIDPATGSVRLKATFPNDDLALWPGQFVSIRLQLKILEDVVTVPSTAIQRGPDGMYVYIVKPDQTAAIQPVTDAQLSGGTAVIAKGLTAGTRVVVSGQYSVQPGSRVVNADSANLASTK
jgi:multidrug efflux system membrane fusion protein